MTRAVPFLGICVGMQMLATTGHEYEETPGFGWIAGDIRRITPADPALKVPHMGWNDLVIDHPHPVLDGISTGDHAYFVHSYAMDVAHPTERLAHVNYAGDITAIVGRAKSTGPQFFSPADLEAWKARKAVRTQVPSYVYAGPEIPREVVP